jgi:hypothetical protein
LRFEVFIRLEGGYFFLLNQRPKECVEEPLIGYCMKYRSLSLQEREKEGEAMPLPLSSGEGAGG